MSALIGATFVLIVGATTVLAGPSKKDWQRAEGVLRAHFETADLELVDVTAKKKTSLGTSFWVRYQTGGGGLVVVRGNDVHRMPGDATIVAILKADKQLTSKTITAKDLLYLLEQLGTLPALPSKVISEHRERSINPRLVHAHGEAQLVIHCARQVTRGATQQRTLPLVRATLTIGKDYALSWSTEDVEVRTDD